MDNIAIIGGSGAIGQALTQQLAVAYPDAKVQSFSRSPEQPSCANIVHHCIDYHTETSIAAAASLATATADLDLVVVATGMLHSDNLMPEKSLRDLNAANLQQLFEVNTVLPALIAKHFIPRMHQRRRAVFAALSARVGSISDNRLGGWYAYRASKAALNMLIKSAAIEVGRRNKQAVVVGLHPGTVDSQLSRPFQTKLAANQLFTATFSAKQLLNVILALTPAQSGRCFAWDGQEIAP